MIVTFKIQTSLDANFYNVLFLLTEGVLLPGVCTHVTMCTILGESMVSGNTTYKCGPRFLSDGLRLAGLLLHWMTVDARPLVSVVQSKTKFFWPSQTSSWLQSMLSPNVIGWLIPAAAAACVAAPARSGIGTVPLTHHLRPGPGSWVRAASGPVLSSNDTLLPQPWHRHCAPLRSRTAAAPPACQWLAGPQSGSESSR